MQLSLEAVFGAGSASIAVGNVLGSQREITASGHAQTTFVHNDYIYLLDATPYSGVGRGWRFGFGRGTRFSPPHTATLEDLPAIPDQPDADLPAIDLAELRLAHLSSLQNALEMQLAVLFSVRDRQALYERVANLSIDDPVRRTLEVFIRASRDETNEDEIEALKTYLGQYKAAPASLLARMGVPAYDPNVIDSLTEPLWSIARYYR